MKSLPNIFPSERANKIVSFLINRGNQAHMARKQPRWNERELSNLACERYPSGEVELPSWVTDGHLD